MAYPGVMNDLQSCIEGRIPDRMPVFALGLEFDMGACGLSYEDARCNVEKAASAIVRSVERFDYDWALVFPDDYVEFEPLGLRMRSDPDLPAMVSEYLPLAADTLSQFRIPDPGKDMRLPIQLETIRRVRCELGDTVCVVGRIAAPFSTLGLIYGIDSLLFGIVDTPALIRDNMEFFVEHQIAFGLAQLEAGAHALWLGDCVAGSSFLSPRHFEEFALEPASRVASALMKRGGIVIYHSAETSLSHLRLQTEMPVSAINVGEGPSIAQIRDEIGCRRCLMGNFDPLLLRDGEPSEIAAAAELMVAENLLGGGYVFNTGEGVMRNTPVRNVEAMVQAARKSALPRHGTTARAQDCTQEARSVDGRDVRSVNEKS